MTTGVSIVIPVYNGATMTRECLDALIDQEIDAEIVVIDDASTDETEVLLSSYGDKISVLRNETNRGFAATCNRGAAASSGELVVFLNNDTRPEPGWLRALCRHAEKHPEAAVVGSKLLFPDGRIQHAGVAFGPTSVPFHIYYGLPGDHPATSHWRRLQAVTAACMLVRREVFDAVGGFDEGFVNAAEDVDLCLRIGELGEEIHYCPDARIQHLESATRGRQDRTRQSDTLFLQRWKDRVAYDELEILRADGLLEIAHSSYGRILLRIDPLVGSMREPDPLSAEAAIDDLSDRWVAALHQRDEATARLRKRDVVRVRVDSLGTVHTPTSEPDWRYGLPSHSWTRAEFLRRKVQPLPLLVSKRAPARINIVYEGLDPSLLFGGHAAMLQLADRLTGAGRLVRIIGVDLPYTPGVREQAAVDVPGASRLSGIEYVDAHQRDAPITISPDDRFVATSWWTMRIATDAAQQVSAPPPLWMVQEYEPVFYPAGAFAAMARTTYDLPHTALISSHMLKDYLEANNLGCFATGAAWEVFENPLTTAVAASMPDIGRYGPRRLMAYLRSAPRNLAEIVLAGMDLADMRGDIPPDWYLTGVGGELGGGQRLELTSGRPIDLFERMTSGRYLAMLRSHDVGIALQDSPHPGLVTLDMAAAGMLAITSVYGEAKSAERLRSLSGNILAAEPEPEAVADSIAEAVARAADAEARLRDSDVRWPRTPEDAYPADLIDRVLAMIG